MCAQQGLGRVISKVQEKNEKKGVLGSWWTGEYKT